MNKKGEIVVVDDDNDDIEIVAEALKTIDIPNKAIFFNSADEALAYLRKPDADPFLILCDFRMPRINGLEFRQMMYADKQLIKKAVPFILYSTTVDSETFNTALMVGVQGFFVKPSSVDELSSILRLIFQYCDIAIGNPQL
jgi:CheY-like chemotaxis protein